MLTVSPLKQSDPQWADELLGNSKTLTIGNSGCALTALTMLYNFVTGKKLNPSEVNKKLKAVNGFGGTSGALIIWAKVHEALPELKWVYRDYNYQNAKVAWYVYIKRIPVMVEVIPSSAVSSYRHWVLFLGDQKMADPFSGTIRPTNTYPLSGDSLITKS